MTNGRNLENSNSINLNANEENGTKTDFNGTSQAIITAEKNKDYFALKTQNIVYYAQKSKYLLIIFLINLKNSTNKCFSWCDYQYKRKLEKSNK